MSKLLRVVFGVDMWGGDWQGRMIFKKKGGGGELRKVDGCAVILWNCFDHVQGYVCMVGSMK